MKNPHSLEKPAATLIAAATLLAGMGLPPAALAADGSASAPSSSASGNGADDKDQTNAGDTTTWTLMGAVLTADDKGTLTLPDGQSLPTFDKRPDNASVQGSDGTTIPLTLADAAEEHPNLGVTTGTGILTAEAKDGHPAVHVPATWTTGTATTLSDGTPFTLKDGAWEASYGRTLTLKDDNEPPVRNIGLSDGSKHEITWSQDYSYTLGKRVEATGPDGHDIGFIAGSGYLSATVTASLDQANQPKDADVTIDGRKAQVTWSGQVHTTTTDTTTTYTRQGRVEGDVKVAGTDRTQHWIVYVSASRTEGHVAGLSLIQRKPDGTTSRHDISGFDPSRHEYAITMPADAVADQYTLGHTSAAGDKADVSEGDPVAPTLGANASRILKTTLNGVTYTVTVDFEKAKPTPSNPHARLNGLYVDLTGKAGKGALIDGWDPDVLDYTIRIGANDPGAYILPEAPSGVSVKAGDVTRAGYATTQYWTTRSADGQSRTYSVTVVRDHGTPTAEEAFTPGAAKDTDGQTPAASRDDTTLVSHGYLLDGEYHAVKATDYTIPEGGTFAYASKQGQIVQVSESKVRGMSWRYTLNILAPDGVTLANPAPAFTVTYLTRATHEAAITSIIVDGRAIDGFDPSKHEYTAQVDNIDHWTASADFDKSTGMGVTIHKDHDKATITATSADGLTKSTYTLKVSEKPLTLNRAGIDGATVEGLASTGADTASMISVVAVLLAAGVACLAAGLTRRLHRGKRDDAPSDDGTGVQDAE